MNDINKETNHFSSQSLVFIALILLTLISYGISQLNIGILNPIFSIAIGIISALIILVQYMNISLKGSFFRLLAAGVFALILMAAFIAAIG